MHFKEQERSKEANALKEHFKPVAVIGVHKLGFHILMVNSVNRIQEWVMKEEMGNIEPDIVAEDSRYKEEHLLCFTERM